MYSTSSPPERSVFGNALHQLSKQAWPYLKLELARVTARILLDWIQAQRRSRENYADAPSAHSSEPTDERDR